MQAMHPGLSRGHDWLGHCGLSHLLGAAVLHSQHRGLPRPAVVGSNVRASEEIVMEEKTESAWTVWCLDASGQRCISSVSFETSPMSKTEAGGCAPCGE